MPENASFWGYFAEVSFDNSEEKQLSCFQNGKFFKMNFYFHKTHNKVRCR